MLHKLSNNYFFSSFFWSTLSKILNAILGFISIPLLLEYFGKVDYGLLTLATSCNGYMHLMDLGMNTGAVKFFAQWEAEGKRNLIYHVSRTNITFYLIISIINIIGLLVLAFWGESYFSVTHEQFMQLRYCFLILAIFATISWVTTVFQQLLTAYKMLDFTMKIQCLIVILKGGLIAMVLLYGLSLSEYFFYLCLIIAFAIVPYAIKCKSEGFIDTLKPANYWSEFRIVVSFSVALFALSLFQVTATQSRPIILGICAEKGAEVVADFKIVEVIPQFIITVCGTFISIFLPKSSEIIVKNDRDAIQNYVCTWTNITTILICILCCPFIVGADNILSAYVGDEYKYLSIWLQIWCFFLIVQMHSTPAYSFILANGKTKVLVITTSIACIFSMVVNVYLSKIVPVGSAIIGYVVYISCLIWVYYFYIYKKYLKLRRHLIFVSFIKPLFLGMICMFVPYLINIECIFKEVNINYRIGNIVIFFTKTIMWLIPYVIFLFITRTLKISDLRNECIQ